jgi:hypothetical protein
LQIVAVLLLIPLAGKMVRTVDCLSAYLNRCKLCLSTVKISTNRYHSLRMAVYTVAQPVYFITCFMPQRPCYLSMLAGSELTSFFGSRSRSLSFINSFPHLLTSGCCMFGKLLSKNGCSSAECLRSYSKADASMMF